MRSLKRIAVALALCATVLLQPLASAPHAQLAGQERVSPCAGGQEGLLSALDVLWDRQVAMMRERGFDPKKQAMKIATWLKGLPPGAAALIMVGEGSQHCAYLVDGSGVKAFSIGQKTPAEVKLLHAAWREAAGVDQTTTGRRGLSTDDGRGGFRSRAREADEALTGLSLALLPAAIREAIPGYSRVMVLPYGDLGAAPFAALPLEEGGQRLVDVASVMVLPGVQLAKANGDVWVDRRGRRNCRGRPEPTTSAMVVGDPTLDPDGSNARLSPLPGARREALAVGKIVGVEPIMGEAATLAAVRGGAEDTRFIHMAAHGVALPDTPLESYIALADSRWTAGEIMQSCLSNVSIAVLSACQTGLGKAVDGGVIGLARAFYLAGVDDVVMTLWSVDDEATVLLMTTFSQQVKAGLKTDEALRRAMLKTRETYPNPVNWAAFSVFGSSMMAEEIRN